MSRKRIAALSIAALAAIIAACGSEVTQPGDDDATGAGSSSGGGGQGGAGGEGGNGCPDPPFSCYGMWSVDENGCTICEPGSCTDCDAGQLCSNCYYANGTLYSCHDSPTPGAGEFACLWTGCAVGMVCQDRQPVGDGCEEVACEVMPPECEAAPTCDCLLLAFPSSYDCVADADGNLTIKGSFF